MFQWYKKVVFENYANFSGRARRSEYWYFALVNLLIAILAFIIDSFLGLNFDEGSGGPLYLLVALGTLLPGLAVMVRRLHDQNKSGLFVFIFFVPLIGSIWLLILLFTDGTSGKNKYGDDPKNPFEEINEIGLE
mgnify:CR=1 FL=1